MNVVHKHWDAAPVRCCAAAFVVDFFSIAMN
jgi:hypothetical protein